MTASERGSAMAPKLSIRDVVVWLTLTVLSGAMSTWGMGYW